MQAIVYPVPHIGEAVVEVKPSFTVRYVELLRRVFGEAGGEVDRLPRVGKEGHWGRVGADTAGVDHYATDV